MRTLSTGYLIRRVLMFVLTVWLGATMMFIIPRLAPGDPVAAMVSRMAAQSGYVENSAELIESWRKKFGLDQPVPVQYLRYLGNLATFNLGLYITHDLSTAYQISDAMHVLYQGSVVERGETVAVIEHPKHPYVQLLINSIPVPDPKEKWETEVEWPSEEEGRSHAQTGCRFAPRCPHRMDRCVIQPPPLYKIDGARQEAACFLYDGGR